MNKESKSVPDGRKFNWALGLGLPLIAGLLVVVIWQQRQLAQHSGSPAAEGGDSVPVPGRTLGPPQSAGDLLEEQREALRSATAEETGHRMFEELRIVAGDDDRALKGLVERLVEEGRARRELENSLAEGSISQAVFDAAVYELAVDSETLAQELLDPEQFDRYREVRQSWKRGRAHPDRDSRQ